MQERFGRMVDATAAFMLRHGHNLGARPGRTAFVRTDQKPTVRPAQDLRAVASQDASRGPRFQTVGSPGPAWDRRFVPLTSAYEPACEPSDPADATAKQPREKSATVEPAAPLGGQKGAQPVTDLRGSDVGDATRDLDTSAKAIQARETTGARVGQPIEIVKEEARQRAVLERGARGILNRYVPAIQARMRQILEDKGDDGPVKNLTGRIEHKRLFGKVRKVEGYWRNERREGVDLHTTLKPGSSPHDFDLSVHMTEQVPSWTESLGELSLQHQEGKKTNIRLGWGQHVGIKPGIQPNSERLQELVQQHPALAQLILLTENLAPSEDVSHQEITVTIHEPSQPSKQYAKGTLFTVIVQASQVDRKTTEETALEEQLRKERSATYPITILAAMDMSGWSLSGVNQGITDRQHKLDQMRQERYHTITYRLGPGENSVVGFTGTTANTSATPAPITVEVVTDDILAGLLSLIPTDLTASADELTTEPVTLLAFPGHKIGVGQELENPEK